MNATERAALLHGLDLHDAMTDTVGERTLEILERRRRTATVRRRGWLVRRVLLAADICGLVCALFLAEWVVNRRSAAGALGARDEIVVFCLTLPAWVVVAKLYGLYDRDEERTDHSTVDDFVGVFHMVTVCTWLFTVLTYLTGVAHPTAPKLVLFWGAAALFVSLGRAFARTLARRSVLYLQNTVIVGAGEVGQLIAAKFLNHPEYGINVVGFVDAQPRERRSDLQHLALLGEPAKLPAIIRLFDVERVVVAFSSESHEETLEMVARLKELDMQIDIVPRLFETVGPNVGFHVIEGIPLVGLPPLRLSASSAFIKRAMDISLATISLILLGPVMLVVALMVKVESCGPIFYRHERVGRAEKPIDVLKFRTMRREACRGARYGGDDAEAMFDQLMNDPALAREFATTYKMSRDPRTTRLGGILRRTSVDELPQLFNVLRGELSLVGPRAVTADELSRYGNRRSELTSIRPGITGYWQINGRSRLSYDDRVRLDLSYITSWSLRLDLEILAKTLRTLAARRGAV